MPSNRSRRTASQTVQEAQQATERVDATETMQNPDTPAMANVERIRRAMATTEEQSVLVKQITEETVARYSRELDEFVQNVKGILDRIKRGEVQNISDRALELNTIKLPVLMYFAGNGLEQLGCESDVAKARRSEEYNRILTEVAGTIPHRQAMAENRTLYETLTETIYVRAYKQLKSKMEMADKLFSALKKVLSKRMMEMELAGREVNYNGRDAEDSPMEGERDNG